MKRQHNLSYNAIKLRSSPQYKSGTNFFLLQFADSRPWYGFMHTSNDFENNLGCFVVKFLGRKGNICSFSINPFSARGPIYRPPLCLRIMREADVSAHFFQALQ